MKPNGFLAGVYNLLSDIGYFYSAFLCFCCFYPVYGRAVKSLSLFWNRKPTIILIRKTKNKKLLSAQSVAKTGISE